MDWREDENHPFFGIGQRLKRANENIDNLESEISRFFKECKYPRIPDPKDEMWQDAIDYHLALSIPRRFSILTGEIIHHWRSCLDHIVWIFSSAEYRAQHETLIQFPIFRKPLDTKHLKRFEGQIGGIPNPGPVRDRICEMQPYNFTPNALDSPLWIIHDMDIVDKHQELVIVHAAAEGMVIIPTIAMVGVARIAVTYGKKKPISVTERNRLRRAFKDYGAFTPQIAFAEIGNRKDQLLIPSLEQLRSALERTVAEFVAFV